MAFSDRNNSVTGAADEITRIMQNAAAHAAACTARIRQLVTTYTRAAIAAELGTDAAGMLNLYNQLENFRSAEMGDAPIPLP